MGYLADRLERRSFGVQIMLLSHARCLHLRHDLSGSGLVGGGPNSTLLQTGTLTSTPAKAATFCLALETTKGGSFQETDLLVKLPHAPCEVSRRPPAQRSAPLTMLELVGKK